jgi:hypothetical protein
MDERDMEEEGKDREEEELKRLFFGISWNCYFMFITLNFI